MPTQLFFDLTTSAVPVHFCERHEFETIEAELAENQVAVMPIDGTSLRCRDDLFRAFAVAFRKPKGWYGEEEYAPNADAFLEYVDDVEQWVPAKGRVAIISNAEQFWREQPRIAALLVELWQFATIGRSAKTHLLFVW